MSEPTKPSPTTRKAAASPLGQSGTKASYVRFRQSLQFSFGMIDGVRCEKAPDGTLWPHLSYELKAEEITVLEHGVNFVVKDPKATQPREVFIFAANISYVLPAASEGA
jgi:hypothetical protein